MNLKLLLLTDGTYVISWVYELPEEPKGFLAYPMQVVKSGKGITLNKFPYYSEQDFLLLYSNSICTIVEPDENLKSKYKTIHPDEPDIELPETNTESEQLLSEGEVL
jgi:hypothetical protein